MAFCLTSHQPTLPRGYRSIIVVQDFFLDKGVTVRYVIVINDLVILERVITSISTVDGDFVPVKIVVTIIVSDLFESLSLLDRWVRILTIVIIDLILFLLSRFLCLAVLIRIHGLCNVIFKILILEFVFHLVFLIIFIIIVHRHVKTDVLGLLPGVALFTSQPCRLFICIFFLNCVKVLIVALLLLSAGARGFARLGRHRPGFFTTLAAGVIGSVGDFRRNADLLLRGWILGRFCDASGDEIVTLLEALDRL